MDAEFATRMDKALHAAAKTDGVDEAIDAFIGECDDEDLEAVFGTTDRDEIKESVSERVNTYTDDVLASLEHRIDALGVVQPNIQRVVGTNRISVELPGVKEPERVKKILTSSALLEFWAVGEGYDAVAVAAVLAEDAELQGKFRAMESCVAPFHVGVADYEYVDVITEYLADPVVKSKLPYGVKLAWEQKSVDGKTYGDFRLVVLKGTAPLMDGSGIVDASAQSSDKNGSMVVSLSMNGDAAEDWAEVTANNVGKAIAIVMDGVVYSAPNVNEPITGGQSQICGDFSVKEAEDLANILICNRMPVSPVIVSADVRTW